MSALHTMRGAPPESPAIHLCLARAADPAHAVWVALGAEEEGVPCRVTAGEGATATELAYAAARQSRLGVGVGITAGEVALHEQHMPAGRPVLALELRGDEPGRCRLIGGNAARIVVHLPLRFEEALQEDQPMSSHSQGHDITLDQALEVIAAARRKAEEQGTLMDIAVVDAGANLKAFVRMDDAFLGSIDIAIKKARTARMFNMPTGDLGKLAQPGGPLFNIEHSNDGLITFPGGLPLKNAAGVIIGAVGVSGSSVENDHEVAVAGAQTLL